MELQKRRFRWNCSDKCALCCRECVVCRNKTLQTQHTTELTSARNQHNNKHAYISSHLACVKMYLWWSLCTLYTTCQVTVTVGDSGFCCSVCFERWLTPLCVETARALWASFCLRLKTCTVLVKRSSHGIHVPAVLRDPPTSRPSQNLGQF